MAGASKHIDLGGKDIDARIDALATQIARRLERLVDYLDIADPQPIKEWRFYAACAFTYNPAIKGEESMDVHRDDIRALKRLCAGCPVTQECLGYARTMRVREGVWGGKVWHPKRQW